MSLTKFRKIAYTTFVATLLLALAPLLRAESVDDSREITQLLSQAKATATLVTHDAETLESYTRSRISWQTHARQLERMRGHTNELIEDVRELSALRSQGSPWQQEAIDRINPMLKDMADHLTATIEHLNDNRSSIHFQPYQDYARGNRIFADKTLVAIRDFVDYGEARAAADSLEQKLTLPAASGE
ncbi:MAG TPA: hypothetical protein VHE33_15590 [Acidobacteriaceae bacterium]|nr:hypothetical protein [Acidobacteriaceae bacterium]